MKRRAACIVPVFILLLSCSGSIQTFSDKDNDVDLKQYKSYAWIGPGDTVLNAERRDKLFGGLIVHSSNEELAKKGMAIDVTKPDALFAFETKLEEKVVYTESSSMSVGFGYGGPGYYIGGSAPVLGGDIKASYFEEGVLFISMHDAQTGKLLWTGGAKKTLNSSTDVEQVVKTAVKHIFMRLPIKHKNK